MAERKNGRSPRVMTERRAHGTERQGMFAVPSKDLLQRQEQSRRNRQELINALLEKQFKQTVEVVVEEEVVHEIGNKELPVFEHKQEIIEAIQNNRAVIIISATGGGKSTQVPQFMYEAGAAHVHVLQQRRTMVDGLSDRIQKELNDTLGEEAADNLVGAVHGKRVDLHDNNRITPTTAATFVKRLPKIEAEYGDEEVVIFLDEAHEDDLQMELAVGVAGIAAARHPKWRIVVASATIDPDPLKTPLGRITNFTNPETVEVPILKIEGRPHNMEMHEASNLNPAEAFLEHGDGHRVSILATRGFEQLGAMRKVIRAGLEKHAPGSSEDVLFREYSSKTTTYQRAEIARLAENLPEGKRLVVVATPAARSGITIPGTSFVATDGLVNREVRDEFGARGLIASVAAKAEIIQTLGRGGRDVDGAVGYICRPMPRETKASRVDEYNKIYPFVPFEEREEYPTPAIFNSNLSELLLSAASANADLLKFNKLILNEQDAKVLNNAINRLRNVFGALDENGKITEIGRLMSRFPVASEISRGLAEGMLKGRSRQHMARMALIAAAVDVGGLQDYRENRDEAEWRSFLGVNTDDDYIAQLDFLLAIERAKKDFASETEAYQFAYLNDLNYGRVASLNEPVEKILRRMFGPRGVQVEVEPPTREEIEALREDFTAGMFDLVHKHAGVENRERVFAHIKDLNHQRLRTIASYSATVPANENIIAGMPVFYEKIVKGELQLRQEIAMTLKVDPAVVGHYAIQYGQAEYIPVNGSARVNGGMVVSSERAIFGSLVVGNDRVVKMREHIPKESQSVLVEYIQNHPGPELLLLRELAQELAEYRRIMPTEELNKLRRTGAPVDFTESKLTQLVRYYAQRTRNIHEIDYELGKFSSENNISVDLYYDTAARQEIIRRSPQTLQLGDSEVDIRYDNGNPYITRLTKDQERFATQPIFLEDGREVLRQMKVEGVRGTQRVSFGVVVS